jgi:hypothetical protein
MVVIKKKKVNEDDVQNNNSNQENQQKPADQTTVNQDNQIVNLLKQKADKKTEYQNSVRNIENQILQIEKEKAEKGGEIDTDVIESTRLSYSFWKKLYESTDGRNRTDEMYMIISMSFSQIDDLSYQPTTTWCKTFAKRVVEYLNKDYSGFDAFVDFIEKCINSGQISLSMREKSAFISNFEYNIRNSRILEKFGYTLEEN